MTKKEILFFWIIDAIKNGKYKVNQKIPSIRWFSLYFKISINTVKDVMQQLSKLGILDNSPNVGYFVLPKKYNLFRSESQINNVTKKCLEKISNQNFNYFSILDSLIKSNLKFIKKYYYNETIFKVVVMVLCDKYNDSFEILEDSLFSYLRVNNVFPKKIYERFQIINTNLEIKQLLNTNDCKVAYITTIVFDNDMNIAQQACTYVLCDYFDVSFLKKM